MQSPDNNIEVKVYLDENNSLRYNVSYEEHEILSKSKLGIIRDGADFTDQLKLVSGSDVENIVDKYSMMHGKQKEITYTADQKIYHFENGDGEKKVNVRMLAKGGFVMKFVEQN